MGAACCCITAPDDDPPQNTSAPRAHLGATLAQVTIQADTPNTRGSRASSVGDLNPRLSDKSTKLAATKRKKHMHFLQLANLSFRHVPVRHDWVRTWVASILLFLGDTWLLEERVCIMHEILVHAQPSTYGL